MRGHYFQAVALAALYNHSQVVYVNIVSFIVIVQSVTLPRWFSTGPAFGSTFV